ncbi:dTMP kinase [Streptomyces canus]|uniref:dTMP kinase n=1 Tax=Streptomyces canus TaxID=58343 RepID=UPI00340A6FD6
MLEDVYAAASVLDSGRYLTTVNELCDQIPALRPQLLRHVVERLRCVLDLAGCTKILVEEEKGAVIGAALALETGIPLAMARAYPYSVPGHRVGFVSEYAQGDLYVNGVEPGDRVCLVDDTLSTGGTLVSLISAVRQIGAEVGEIAVVVEKAGNGGREALDRLGLPVSSLIEIEVTADGVTVHQPSRLPAGRGDVQFLETMRPHREQGLFIVVEGTDGAGKTTLVNGLAASLRAEGRDVFTTFQPTASARATDVFRGFAERGGDDPAVHRALYLVTLGDRLYHARATILPELAAGRVVICDRYIYTTIANALARGQRLESWFRETVGMLPKPDLAVLVHSPVEVAVKRIRERAAERDRAIDLAHMEGVHAGFQRLVADGQLIGLDTDALGIEQTHARVRSEVDALLESRETVRSLAL